jgi:hypothetical protein
MSKYDLNLNELNLSSIKSEKYFVLGIGGGNDVVSACTLATLIKNSNPHSQVAYGLCVSPKKNYNGFTKVSEGLHVRGPNDSEMHEHHSVRLLQKLKKYDGGLGAPYLLTAENGAITKEAMEFFSGYKVITVDNGGDSLTGGRHGKDAFDYKNILTLREMGICFHHIVFGLGCDGESCVEKIREMLEHCSRNIVGKFSMDIVADILFPMLKDVSAPERKNVDTTVIIRDANLFMKNNPGSEELYQIPRHERQISIPYTWLNTAVVLNIDSNFADPV